MAALLAIPLLTALTLLRPFLPALGAPPIERLLGLTDAWRVVEEPLLDLLAAGEWATVWRVAVAANVAAGLLRAWAALDAAACARTGRQAHRRAARPATPAATARPGQATCRLPAGRWYGVRSAGSALLAAVLVVAPHAGVTLVGYAARPLLDQVLVPQARPATNVQPEVAAASAAAGADAARPVWDGTSRLNVLLLGTDRRPQEATERPWGNSDTILLVSVDPGAHGAAMVSVPRDLYLTIPGVGPEKINAAYREGGPPLAVRVVSDLLAQPVHRWASVDLTAFATIVDAVGGVIVDVEHPLRDDEYPTDNYNVRRILVPAGLQWLDGERALWYARSRHGSNDFERANRQQHLLLSLRARARDPRTIARIPALSGALADAVQTDITPREALALARLATSTDLASVRSVVLAPPAYGREIIRPDLYAIQPDVARIQKDVADALGGGQGGVTGAPVAPVTPVAPVAPVTTSPPTIRVLPLAPVGAMRGQGGGGAPDSVDVYDSFDGDDGDDGNEPDGGG